MEKKENKEYAQKKDQDSLVEEEPADFRLENKFFRARFWTSMYSNPQNVHTAEAWEESLVK